MANPKLERIPSMRERVQDTLSANRNVLVSLLSRFLPSFLSLSLSLSLSLVLQEVVTFLLELWKEGMWSREKEFCIRII
jgi:hypothetical protein